MMSIPILIVLFAILTNINPAKAAMGISNYQGEDDAVERWHKINDMLQGGMKKLTKTVLPYAMRLSSGLNLSTSCVRDGLHVFNGLRKLDPMATRFIDASGKMIDGIAVGTLGAVGAFDECLDTEVFINDRNGKKNLMYRGQYCTLELKPPLPKENRVFKTNEVIEGLENFTKSQSIIAQFAKTARMFYVMSFRFGLCVPSGCTKDDVNQLAIAVGNSIYINANVTHCELKEPNKFYPITIAAISIYSITLFLVLVGSFLDRNRKRFSEKGTLFRCLLQFSFFKSYSKLIKVEDQSEYLKCLNGIRFITLCWITLMHTYAFINFNNLKSSLRVLDYIQDFAFQFVVNAFHVSDTFFVIGGAVSCYVVVNYVKTKGRPFNVPMYIINRLARILPVYIYFILFVFMLDLFGSGPYWNDYAAFQVKNCYEKWWYNLLFINNLIDAESTCAHHTWYLACDFQFYLAAIIILLPLIKRPKVGVWLSVLVIIASSIACGFLTWFNDYPPTVIINLPDFTKTREYLNYYFFRPYSHAGPYFIGLLLGYMLAVKPTLKLSKKIQVLCWALAFTSSFSMIYGSVGWNRGRAPNVVETLFFASLSKNAWALSVAWMIYACATGYGGYLNRFLSWEGFVPLGRLSFMAYLVHPAVILVYVSSLQTMQQASHFFMVWLFFGNLCVTFILSFAASMLVEAPFISLTKMMFSRGNRTERSDESETVKSFPIHNLHLHCDFKSGIDKGNNANHETTKVYAEALKPNGVVSNGIHENKENRIKLSDLIAQNNFHDIVSGIEKHELEDVKVEDNKTSDRVESNESISEIIVKHEHSEESEKKCHIHHKGAEESEKEYHMHLNGFSEAEKEAHIHLNGSGESGKISHPHLIGNGKGGKDSHIDLNGIKTAKNSSKIPEAEKSSQDIDVDVKATYFPGLGWKLG